MLRTVPELWTQTKKCVQLHGQTEASDHVNWAKLMQILKETCFNGAKENYQQIVHRSEC
jgi:hypothetical protein